MTTYNEGDLVRASKGDTVVQGRVGKTDGYAGDGGFYLPGLGWGETGLEREGFTIELIEAAKSPTVAALEDAPVGSYVHYARSEDFTTYVRYMRFTDGWLQIDDWEGVARVQEKRGVEELAKLIDGGGFTLYVPNGA